MENKSFTSELSISEIAASQLVAKAMGAQPSREAIKSQKKVLKTKKFYSKVT